jgi:hypothetical protein
VQGNAASSIVQYHSIAVQLEDLERRGMRREQVRRPFAEAGTCSQQVPPQLLSKPCVCERSQELQQIIQNSAQKNQLEKLLMKADYEHQLQEKDCQIRVFRQELDAILASMEVLKSLRRDQKPSAVSAL